MDFEENIRKVFEDAYKTMQEDGIDSIIKHSRLLEKKETLKKKMLSYYESTEEFEKCKFIVDFFINLDKKIALQELISSLENNKK